MKLAKVVHIRCHERHFNEPITLVWVDNAMTEEEFEQFVKAARDAYDLAGKTFASAEPEPRRPWRVDEYRKHPNMTVAEVDFLCSQMESAHDRWKKLKEEAQKDFMYHLASVSGGRIKTFWSQRPPIVCEFDWGHRHGQNIAFSETKISDLPGTVPHENHDL